MKSRRKARKQILQRLYEADLSGGIPGRLGGAYEDSGAEKGADFSRRLLSAVVDNSEEIDRIISENSEHWSIERMPAVDRNLLRIAVAELLCFEDVPYKVVIDEAVELAKKFGSEDSASFVNGVLDRAAKKLRPEETEAGSTKPGPAR